MVLPGGVQEPRPPAERGRPAGAFGEVLAHVGQVGVAGAVEVGHHGEVAVLPVDLAQQVATASATVLSSESRPSVA